MPRPSHRPAARPPLRQRGASLTEFVIVAPVAILLTFGILQAGMLYMAKLTLNNATFMAARTGAVKNAKLGEIKDSLAKGMVPFYQDATNGNDLARIGTAYARAKVDSIAFTTVDLISPSSAAFGVYGITDKGVTYIPNDNLEFRTATPMNGAAMSIRDANVLRIKVTYGYELKVPLMAAVIKRLMCPGFSGSDIQAWDRVSLLPWGNTEDCLRYYMLDRLPIVSYATVQMQSRPER